jgi:hypothetical protein
MIHGNDDMLLNTTKYSLIVLLLIKYLSLSLSNFLL